MNKIEKVIIELILTRLRSQLPDKGLLTEKGRELLAATRVKISEISRTADPRSQKQCDAAVKILAKLENTDNFSHLQCQDIEQFVDYFDILSDDTGSLVPHIFDSTSEQLAQLTIELAKTIAESDLSEYIDLAPLESIDLSALTNGLISAEPGQVSKHIKEVASSTYAQASLQLGIYQQLHSHHDIKANYKTYLKQLRAAMLENKEDPDAYLAYIGEVLNAVLNTEDFLLLPMGRDADATTLFQHVGNDSHQLPTFTHHFRLQSGVSMIINQILAVDAECFPDNPQAYHEILKWYNFEDIFAAIENWKVYRRELLENLNWLRSDIEEYKNPYRYLEIFNKLDPKSSAATAFSFFGKSLISAFLPTTNTRKIRLLETLAATLANSLQHQPNHLEALFQIHQAIEAHKIIVQEEKIRAGECASLLTRTLIDVCVYKEGDLAKLFCDGTVMHALVNAYNREQHALGGEEISAEQCLHSPLDDEQAVSTADDGHTCTSTSSSC